MSELLTLPEVVSLIERVLRRAVEDEEEQAWLHLADRSLQLPEGTLGAILFYPEESGLPEDPTAEEVVALALARRDS